MSAAARVCLRTAYSRLPCARLVHVSATVDKVVQFNLSDIGEGIREVTVKGWFVKKDDVVSQFDNICEVESDKATVTITSRFDGRVTKLYHEVGEKALVGQPLLDIDVPDDAESGGSGSSESPRTDGSISGTVNNIPATEPTRSPAEVTWNKSLATPAVRRIAMEQKIKLSDVTGTGKNGRVMKEDILAYVEKTKISDERTQDKVLQNTSVAPLSPVQRVMARKLADTIKIPGFVFCDELDVSKLVRIVSEVKHVADEKGVKFSYLPIFIKAISKALSKYPILNSSYDEQGYVIYKHYHNIGLAFDSPSGLVVPNIKNVQELTILEIAKELNRLKGLASQMKLSPQDVTGGTFTISNIGSIAGTYASPTILPPEVCIVALGKIQKLPRFDSAGNVVAVNILTSSWTADHRIIDGATVARCFQVFRAYLENPAALLLDM